MENPEKKADQITDEADDWCFVCKQGGELLICDFEGCLKSYHHPKCSGGHKRGRKKAIENIESPWICSRHSCADCHESSEFHCLLCPYAICGACSSTAEFAVVKETNGICRSCSKNAIEAVNYEHGERIETDDEDEDEADERLFKEYLDIVLDKEGLGVEVLHAAEVKIKKKIDSNKAYRAANKANRVRKVRDDEDDVVVISDSDGRNKNGKGSGLKKKKSECLMLSDEDDVVVISDGRNKNGKGSGLKKKKKKSEHLMPSDEDDDAVVISDGRNKNGRGSGLKKKSECLMPRRKKNKAHLDRIFKESDGYVEPKKTGFASIVPKNIELVYLRKSLIEKLIIQSDNFEDKVVGSYVGVKKESGKRFGKPSCHLLQVTGIKKSLDEDFNKGVFLQVSCWESDVNISMLYDCDISEELCAELKQKMNDGILKKPTVEELELKARILHEDIKNDWIERELVRLQNVINFANEKGRRILVDNCLDQLKRLKTPYEQRRLLQALPTVIPEVLELKSEDADAAVSD